MGAKTVATAVVAAMMLAYTFSAAAAEPTVLGMRPTYTQALPIEPPNAQAIQSRIWVPGLDEGYVPQGLIVLDTVAFVGAYRSTDRKQDRGPCRVYEVDLATGAVNGHFDVSDLCGHAGGLAYDGNSTLYIVDTRVVLAVELPRSLKDRDTKRAIRQVLKLGGEVRGSLSTWHDGALWIGSWNPKDPGVIFRFPQAALQALGPEATLTEQQATRRLALPSLAQGAAFDGKGKLWVSLSNTKRGQFAVLDEATGAVVATYETSPGVEGLAFASPTRLWTVTEAGSQRWFEGLPFHPLVFALNPELLK
ncbi:MAG TPA: hypothetical protein VF678_05170 [bacterium]